MVGFADREMTNSATSVAVDQTADMDLSLVPVVRRSNKDAQHPPISLLLGERPILLSKTTEGTAMVTNYRFCVCEPRSFINVPLMLIGEMVLYDASKLLRLGCKDGVTYSTTFATPEDFQACTTLLRERSGIPKRMEDLFAVTFHSASVQKSTSGAPPTQTELDQLDLCKPVSEAFAYTFGKEVERLGFDTNRQRLWRMSHGNEQFELCPTYPKYHILPSTVDDRKLKQSLEFRARKRFPSVVWRDQSTGLVLIRSSQPLPSFLGLSYYTSTEDVFLLEEIVNTCQREREILEELEETNLTTRQQNAGALELLSNGTQSQGEGDGLADGGEAQGSLSVVPVGASNGHGASTASNVVSLLPGDGGPAYKLAIVDCRSMAGVWGNSLKGGGTEDEATYKCTIFNLDLVNIHSIRDSFNKLRALCHSYQEGSYYKSLAGSGWLTYISALLKGGNIVVELMKVKKRPVLVHCSDGWDRTSQICALAELMMDSYYRTIEGFQVVVEREWLHFGHKFGERCGTDPTCQDTSEISPIFLQFLDCVYQLTVQNPAEFEFNEVYLIKLLKHYQSCLFGTFFHNCEKEREQSEHPTASVWALLKSGDPRFTNVLYKPKEGTLTARFMEHELCLWQSVYMEGHRNQSDLNLESLLPGDDGAKAEGVSRSKSMDDLTLLNSERTRRNSDPSVTPGQDSAAAASTGPVASEENLAAGHLATAEINNPHDSSSSSVEVLHVPEDCPESEHGKPEGASHASASSEEKVSDRPENGSLSPSKLQEKSVSGETSSSPSAESVEAVVNGMGKMKINSKEPSSHSENGSNGKTYSEALTNGSERTNSPHSDNSDSQDSECTSASQSSPSDQEVTTGASAGPNNSPSKPTNLASSPISNNGTSEGHSLSDGENVSNGVTFNGKEGIPDALSNGKAGTPDKSTIENQKSPKDSSKSAPIADNSNGHSLMLDKNGENCETNECNGANNGHADNSSDADSIKSNSDGDKIIDEKKSCQEDLLGSKGHQPLPTQAIKDAMKDINGSSSPLSVHQRVSTGSESGIRPKTEMHPHVDNVQSSLLSSRLAQVEEEKVGSHSLDGSSSPTLHTVSFSENHSNGLKSPTKLAHPSTSPGSLPSSHSDQTLGPSTPGKHSNGVAIATKHRLNNSSSEETHPLPSSSSRSRRKSGSDRALAHSPTVSSSSTSTLTSPKKDSHVEAGETVVSRRVRHASGASHNLSVSPGNWTDTGRLRHPSSSSETAARRLESIRASVSTSTSDISDSCVGGQIHKNNILPPVAERGSKQPLDTDGLTLWCDPKEDLMTQVINEKERHIMALEQKIAQMEDLVRSARRYRNGLQAQPPAGLDEVPDSDLEEEQPGSLGATSNPSVDSWEPLDETEAKVTDWVPDHTVTHCAACDGLFWIGRWKHHCRCENPVLSSGIVVKFSVTRAATTAPLSSTRTSTSPSVSAVDATAL